MRVYLVRHAHAVPETFDLGDEARWLAPHGRELASNLGARFAEAGYLLDAVVTSPLVRAVQTAELFAAAAGFAGPVEALESMRPAGSPRTVAEDLPARGLAVAAVGHEPHLSFLGAHLCGRSDFPSFQKGEVVLIDDGRPIWSLDPNRLRVEPWP